MDLSIPLVRWVVASDESRWARWLAVLVVEHSEPAGVDAAQAIACLQAEVAGFAFLQY